MLKALQNSLSLGILACTLCSCSLSDYNKIPRNGYIEHFQKSDHKRVPFDSYWDISDNADWNERVKGANHKSQAIYIAPVRMDFFTNMPADPGKQAQIQALRAYFDARLAKVLGELDAENENFHLVPAPTPEAYRVEIALLSAQHGNAFKNLASDTAGFIITGGGLLTSWLTDKGYISMGVRYYAPNGKLVAEVADFEYGQTSLIGMALVDFKDFIDYAYQRQTIDQWVDEFAKLFTTQHEQKVRKPWFTLNPL